MVSVVKDVGVSKRREEELSKRIEQLVSEREQMQVRILESWKY